MSYLLILILSLLSLISLIYCNNDINSLSESLTSLLQLHNDTNIDEIEQFISSLKSLLVSIEDDDIIIDEYKYPPLWNSVKELNSNNFQQNENGAFLINPWDYLHRQALYKHLILTLNDCQWLTDDDNNYPGNIIWGLSLQHGWQYSSGRLLNVANSTIINKDAWWGDMNYYLSVIPYLGAMSNNLVPQIEIDYTSELFCNSIDTCSDVLKPWDQFFMQLNNNIKNCENNKRRLFHFHTPLVDRLDFNMSADMENILGALWNAHLHSINYAKPLFENQLAMLSKPEALFGQSWAQLVDLIAETRLPCNFTLTNILQNVLPPRILLDDDTVPKIKNISRLQNRAVVLIDSINILNEKFHGLIEKTWKRMMCSEQGRAYGREMLTLGMYRLPVIIEDGLTLTKLTISNFPQKGC